DWKNHFQEAQLDHRGRIHNAANLGEHFLALYRIITTNVDIFVLHSELQLDSGHLPLSGSMVKAFKEVIGKGEAAAILLVKHPPEETAKEIRKVVDTSLNGLMSLWADKRFKNSPAIRDGLRDYLMHATVRVMTTAEEPGLNRKIAAINEHLEVHGGFEDSHWIRVVKGVAQDEKKESLKQTLGVCIPIVVAIKIMEHLVPNAIHAVGGVLDDLFGAIIPDVSQSMGDKKEPMKVRFARAWPILKGGLISLPAALFLGWFSAYLHGTSDAVAVHILAGVTFSFACFGGTLGTSVAAFRKSYGDIKVLEEDKTYGCLVADLTDFEKAKLAFNDSIMDVPFRVGHTVVGVPFQIALGVAAGAFGFFHSSIFIMVVGMAETVLGSVTAFAYTRFARFTRNERLRKVKI
ncbi:MAG: hypothetical protein GY765_17485, partial [bacterium]|nr:hypothetical protein [bacterium]